MKNKVDFKTYITESILTTYIESFSPSFQKYLEDIYNNGLITSLAPYITSNKPEEQLRVILNNRIKDNYKLQGHNVGKGIFRRYYKKENVPLWMKVLHYLISQLYFNSSLNRKDNDGRYVNFDRTTWNAGNRKIAIAIGILSIDELDPEEIAKASRKITDCLYILKNDLKVIEVVQTYNPGMKGSGHRVTVDFNELIKLFDHYDVNEKGSIRLRKTIRYRVISFLKNAGNSWKKALDNLIRKQKYSYLLGLVSFDVDEFMNDKYCLFKYMKGLKWLAIPNSMYRLKNIIPVFDKDHTRLTLKVKNEILMKELCNASKYLISDFKENFNINLTVVAS